MKKYKNILFLVIMQVLIYKFVVDIQIFLTTKYFTINQVFYIMISILFNYCYLNYFIEQYYTYILNRNHVIIRCGKNKYYRIILKKIINTTGIFLY